MRFFLDRLKSQQMPTEANSDNLLEQFLPKEMAQWVNHRVSQQNLKEEAKWKVR